ncbi:MAG: GNAT family N-acetyltransferase [Pseudomonadota bacterium]
MSAAGPKLSAGALEGRPFHRDDWPLILALHRAPLAARWLLPPGDEASPARARRVAAAFAEDWAAEGFGPYRWRRGGRAIGYGGLARRVIEGAPEIELLIALTPESWGQGAASAIGCAALEADGPRRSDGSGAHAVGGASVLARIRPDNVAAERLALRLGFEAAGESGWRGLALAHWRWRPGGAIGGGTGGVMGGNTP